MARYSVSPLQKAIEVLKCVGQVPEPMSLKDIALRTSLPKTTVFRYLRTFEAAGMIVHDKLRELYRIDTRVLGMINIASEMERLRRTCLPHMQALCQVSRETVNLGVIEASDIVYLEIVESPYSVKSFARVGGRHPVYTTSIGKAMLAHMTFEEQSAVLPKVLRQRTRRSILERQKLTEEFERCRRMGFAEDDRENEDGAVCVGAPIFNAAGSVVAGLSISGPAERMSSDWKSKVTPALIAHAGMASAELGFQLHGRDDEASEAADRSR